MIAVAHRLHSVSEYYFSKKLKEVRQLIEAGKPIVNMGIGSPDLAPSDKVVLAIQKALFDEKAHEYQNYQGLFELREGMSKFYQQQFDVSLNPNAEILPLMGSKEGIMHISMAFLNEGDEVLVPNPGYPAYSAVANLVGAKAIPYELDENRNWEPDFEMLSNVDLRKVKMMWVSYPHMPTGAKGSVDLLEKLVAFATRNNILLINDNPYSFVLNEKPISIFHVSGAKEVALELNSLSKTFNMAGWRVGMVCGNENLIQAILKVKSNMDSGMFYGIQKGAVEALKLGESWFKSQNEVYSKRRALVYKLAQKLQCEYSQNQVGMFVWAKIPDSELSCEAFVERILKMYHLFIVPGTVFGPKGERYVRFSLCINEEKINEVLNRF